MSDMFDEDFDPLEMLNECQVLINRIIRAHNANDNLLQTLVKQHEQITKLVIANDIKIKNIELEIERLKNHEVK